MIPALFDGLADLIWPAACLGCDAAIPRPGFCNECQQLIEVRDGPRCMICDHDLPTRGPEHRCGRCLERPPPFARVWGLFAYEGPVGDAIRAGKYRRRADGLPAVARTMAAALPGALLADPPDAVIPVPLHDRRIHARKVDPPLALAAAVARGLGCSLFGRDVVRHRDTPAQAGLSEAARRANVTGAFSVRRVRWRDVVLVDDVMTTGATIRAVSRVLRRAGAERIRVLTAAAVSKD